MKITDKLVLFFGSKDVCSNFYPCTIYYDGREFSSSEQLFMYLKAIFFRDNVMANNILKAKTPKEAKSYGRMIRGYDSNLWNKERDNCMIAALTAKYGSCLEFRRFLEKHRDKIFVEASPYDKIWGIGLSETDSNATNPQKWLGENRLGKCINRLIEYIKCLQDTEYFIENYVTVHGHKIVLSDAQKELIKRIRK